MRSCPQGKTCFKCGVVGHVARICPDAEEEKTDTDTDGSESEEDDGEESGDESGEEGGEERSDKVEEDEESDAGRLMIVEEETQGSRKRERSTDEDKRNSDPEWLIALSQGNKKNE